MAMLYKIKEIVNKTSLLQKIYNAFKTVITIIPFYLFRECPSETIADNQYPRMDMHDLEIGPLGPGNMKAISEAQGGKYTEAELLKRLDDGCLCFGIKCRSRVIAWSWSYRHSCNTPLIRFPLKENEAYITNAYTINEYRGRNLAPYLRQKFHQYHHDKGFVTIYAIIEYFNRPSMAFRKKLGFKPTAFYLHIRLFKRLKFTIRLKKYHTPVMEPVNQVEKRKFSFLNFKGLPRS